MAEGSARVTTEDTAAAIEGMLSGLRSVVGADRVLLDDASLTRASMDVYRTGARPIALIKPSDVSSLSKAVRVIAENGVAIVPRGGGASYSDGYVVSDGRFVLVDTSSLDQIEIDETNAIVTVGAGVTWATLRTALDIKGWRSPFWGPFSGIAATVGGTMSQNGISHGSGAYGASAESALAFEVVLASGEVLQTGLAACGGASVLRHFGPDLTGLFTGDCGALGIKTSITLPMVRKRNAFATVSWSFPNFACLHAGMRAVAVERIDDEHFALDAALSQGQIAKEERAGRQGQIAASVIKQKGLAAGLAQLAKMGVAGDRALKSSEYACHFIIEGVDDGETKSRSKRLKALLGEFGTEIPNTVPEVVRSVPFAPLFNTLGPQGERWVPVHGIFSHDAVLAFHVAYDEYCEANAEALEAHGLWMGTMFECVGPSAFLYEIALYWPDSRTKYHEDVIDPAYLATLPKHVENLQARAFAEQVKKDCMGLMAKFGAGHFQIGRAYPYAERMRPSALALLKAVKAELDPRGLMNPGVLGL